MHLAYFASFPYAISQEMQALKLVKTDSEVKLYPLAKPVLVSPFDALGEVLPVDLRSHAPIHKAECGLFGISEDFVEKYQSLDERFIRNREATFFFEAVGRSMEPTIFEGELLVVDRSLQSWNGRVCIVQHEGELLCKRVQIKKDHVFLHSDNPAYQGLKVFAESSSLVWGVVIARVGEVA